MAPHRFRAKLYAVGVNRCVDVPPEVTVALGGDTHIRVKGRVGGEPFRSNLAPRGGGKHRLFVHSDIWRELGVDVGDEVEVEIERDEVEWEIAVPADLAEAMPEGGEALEAFQALTVPNRKRFIDRIEETKTPATRKRRIEQGVQLLIERLRGSSRD
ncbi:MAG: YdeI/OmpD-associated family protein [Chloroflexi bacterium]|nr:YdeI/OmpD-associated family protein [Chloroflexota bacterium]